ncbi:MAG: BlaI/MecI/CopY family transcriptional regulator [Micrococcaceae bacterium]|nr:BlaI/MecI/CopY family transcriptional regulator [Micrococcaceae bacterium]
MKTSDQTAPSQFPVNGSMPMHRPAEGDDELPFEPTAAPQVGPLERRVLDVLWKTRATHSTRSIVDALSGSEGPAPAYTTVATVLGHLVEKSLVAREQIGSVWFYCAALTGCGYDAARMVRSLSDTNDRRRCLARFVGLLDEDDQAMLKALL